MKKNKTIKGNFIKTKGLSFYLGDVRNKESVDDAMVGVNFVFHAAALKQVPSCEFSSFRSSKN